MTGMIGVVWSTSICYDRSGVEWRGGVEWFLTKKIISYIRKEYLRKVLQYAIVRSVARNVSSS